MTTKIPLILSYHSPHTLRWQPLTFSIANSVILRMLYTSHSLLLLSGILWYELLT